MLVQIFFPRKALEFTSLLDPAFQPPCAEVDLVGVVVSVSRTGTFWTTFMSSHGISTEFFISEVKVILVLYLHLRPVKAC